MEKQSGDSPEVFRVLPQENHTHGKSFEKITKRCGGSYSPLMWKRLICKLIGHPKFVLFGYDSDGKGGERLCIRCYERAFEKWK